LAGFSEKHSRANSARLAKEAKRELPFWSESLQRHVVSKILAFPSITRLGWPVIVLVCIIVLTLCLGDLFEDWLKRWDRKILLFIDNIILQFFLPNATAEVQNLKVHYRRLFLHRRIVFVESRLEEGQT
jgi:hypothetical protein